MQAGIRTPAEVIGLVLEEAGVPDFATVAEECAKRLSTALRTVSRKDAEVLIRREGETLEWGTLLAKKS